MDKGSKSELEDRETGQIKKLSKIILEIIESKEFEFQIDQKIKISTTPNEDYINLIKEEFKKIQSHALGFSYEFKDHFEATVTEFRDLKSVEREVEKGTKGANNALEIYGEFYKEWMNDIIMKFVYDQEDENGSNPYLEYNFDSLNSDDIYEFSDSPEKYISLPHLNDLIDCLFTINSYHSWFEHLQYLTIEKGNKPTQQIKIEKKKKPTRQLKFEGELNLSQYKYLYKSLTQNHTYIDENRTSESDFINVFTKFFSSHESKIYFNNESTQISYLFFKIKKYFIHFYKLIEHSEKFISKDGNKIKSNNISSQLSKTVKQGKLVKNQETLDQIIQGIPKEQ